MAIIAPFRAVRYSPARVPNMTEVVSPPYDVIDSEAQAALSVKNPYNMIHLDLSKSVSAENLDESRYSVARDTFLGWLKEGVLIREEKPAIYLYHTDYLLANGRRMTRKGLLCLVRLAEFAEGIVKPHEKTFSGVTSDRLRLLDTCHAQFSPIFSLYPDASGKIMALLEGACPAEPLCEAEDKDGCIHRVWAVSEPELLARAVSLFRDRSLYIADGHHRYTTALQFRALARERLGTIPEDSPYNYTMMYLCGMEDPGLSVLPTHRLVRAEALPALDGLLEILGQHFELAEIAGDSREEMIAGLLARMAEGADQVTRFGLYHQQKNRCFLLSLRAGVMDREFGTSTPASLRDLDVVVLSDLILERSLGLDHSRCEREGLVEYFSDTGKALEAAVAGGGNPLLFLMNPTRVAQVRRVADEGLVMPHKSTYFYPKVLTGLLLNQIVPEEAIG